MPVNSLKLKLFSIIFKYSVRTWKKTQLITIPSISCLLWKSCENSKTLCGKAHHYRQNRCGTCCFKVLIYLICHKQIHRLQILSPVDAEVFQLGGFARMKSKARTCMQMLWFSRLESCLPRSQALCNTHSPGCHSRLPACQYVPTQMFLTFLVSWSSEYCLLARFDNQVLSEPDSWGPRKRRGWTNNRMQGKSEIHPA
jgi:hypothetical protein